jgi:hypothetical protein
MFRYTCMSLDFLLKFSCCVFHGAAGCLVFGVWCAVFSSFVILSISLGISIVCALICVHEYIVGRYYYAHSQEE